MDPHFYLTVYLHIQSTKPNTTKQSQHFRGSWHKFKILIFSKLAQMILIQFLQKYRSRGSKQKKNDASWGVID